VTEAFAFLNAVHLRKPDDTYILLWEKLDRKSSYWFRSIDEAATFAQTHNVNLYCGVNLSPKDYGPYCRCKAADIAAQCAFIADIDIAGPAHKSDCLPTTIDEAQRILPVEFKPTILINSGHGLQGWWVLKEPIVFESDEDRRQSQSLAVEWHRAMERDALLLGYKLDAVYDLSRVLRVPGTVNRKDGVPDVEARILEMNRRFYTLAEIEEYIAEHAPPLHPARERAERQSVRVPGDCARPVDSEAAAESERIKSGRADYLLGWAKEGVTTGRFDGRNDGGKALLLQLRDNGFPFADALALGPRYVQLVADLGDHAYDIKEYRATARSIYSSSPREPLPDAFWPDDLRVTEAEEISEPDQEHDHDDDDDNDDSDEEEIHDDAEDAVEGRPAAAGAAANSQRKPPNAGARAAARALLKENLRLDVARVVKLGEGLTGAYQIELADGRKIDAGRTPQFASERVFRNSVIAGLNTQLPPIKKGRWRKCVDAMLLLVDVEPGFNEAEMITEWIESFLSVSAMDVPSLREATGGVARAFDALNEKFGDFANIGALVETNDGGRVVLRLRSLYRHLTVHLSAKLSEPDLAVLLGKFGFRKVTTLSGPIWQGERLRAQRVWIAPAGKFTFVPRSKRVTGLSDNDPRYCEQKTEGGGQSGVVH
jgi:hypothetical protein